jgi:hypothetical protein
MAFAVAAATAGRDPQQVTARGFILKALTDIDGFFFFVWHGGYGDCQSLSSVAEAF